MAARTAYALQNANAMHFPVTITKKTVCVESKYAQRKIPKGVECAKVYRMNSTTKDLIQEHVQAMMQNQ